MKFSRRKAMGVMAGGAAMAPSALGATMQKQFAAIQPPRDFTGTSGILTDIPQGPSKDDLLDQLNKCNRIINGENDDSKYIYSGWKDHLQTEQINSYKSVSPAAKVVMQMDRAVQQQKKSGIECALEEIKHIKEMLGKIGIFG